MGKIRKFLKKLLPGPKRDPSKPKHEIPPVDGARFNICLTDVLNDRSGPVWTHRNLRSVPWTTALASPLFDRFRDRAHEVYKGMDTADNVVPTVTVHGDGIRMEFERDGEVAVFILYADRTTYGFGKVGEPHPVYTSPEGEGLARLTREGA